LTDKELAEHLRQATNLIGRIQNLPLNEATRNRLMIKATEKYHQVVAEQQKRMDAVAIKLNTHEYDKSEDKVVEVPAPKPKPVKKEQPPTWKTLQVGDGSSDYTHRLKVPGGFLYRSRFREYSGSGNYTGSVSTVFVPDVKKRTRPSDW
jgi:hypothetical protein